MIFTPIVGTLVYVVDDTAVDPSEHRVLMVHRIARKDDDHLGKYNGLGGKLEPGEDVVAGARREIREEAGIELDEITLRGTIVWTGFGPSQEDWLGFIFRGRTSSSTIPACNDEGDLLWVTQKRLLSACDEDPSIRQAAGLPMWEGDRLFLPLVFDTNPVPFHGAMAYEGDRPSDWSYSR